MDVSDEDEEKEEGLRLLLGGLSLHDIKETVWREEVIDDSSCGNDKLLQESVPRCSSKAPVLERQIKAPVYRDVPSTELSNVVYHRAYKAFSDGRCLTPPPALKIVEIAGKGKGLLATEFIPKGSILFTESAAVASQMPDLSSSEYLLPVRACQNCFRSMEPISKLEVGSGASSSPAPLPLPHLWPVAPFDNSCTPEMESNSTVTDQFGRIKCPCGSWFCSKYCHDQFSSQLGERGCCRLVHVLQNTLPGLLDPDVELQSAVVLALRMFVITLHRFRQTGGSLDGPIDCVDEFTGLCGTAADMNELEIGVPTQANSSTQHKKFTLKPWYHQLKIILSLEESEQKALSLEYLHRLAAVAARNAVDLTMQSPFTPYYNALIRAAGGRASPKQEQFRHQVARSLGSDSGQLDRGMDARVGKLVASDVSAIFPLTARINHACEPNAQICSPFMDCRIDVIALNDISAGTEITISYIATGRGIGRKTRQRRQRELQAKYLFLCTCAKCSKEAGCGVDKS